VVSMSWSIGCVGSPCSTRIPVGRASSLPRPAPTLQLDQSNNLRTYRGAGASMPDARTAMIASGVSCCGLAIVLWRRRRRHFLVPPIKFAENSIGFEAIEGTEIIIVRHGQTEWNLQQRIQGSKDSPLTAQGIAAAQELGRRLSRTHAERPIACVYSSPIGRAWTTAHIVAEALPSVETFAAEGLRERSFGVLEELTPAECKAQHPEVQRRNHNREDDYAPPGGGESRAEVRARGHAALVSIARRHPGKRVLVVTHSAFLATIMNRVLNQKHQPNPRVRALALPNTAINMLRWKGDEWQLVVWGDVGEFSTPPVSATLDLLLAAGAGAAVAVLASATFSRGH
jgi:probable phosphoglycerate mutase